MLDLSFVPTFRGCGWSGFHLCIFEGLNLKGTRFSSVKIALYDVGSFLSKTFLLKYLKSASAARYFLDRLEDRLENRLGDRLEERPGMCEFYIILCIFLHDTGPEQGGQGVAGKYGFR